MNLRPVARIGKFDICKRLRGHESNVKRYVAYDDKDRQVHESNSIEEIMDWADSQTAMTPMKVPCIGDMLECLNGSSLLCIETIGPTVSNLALWLTIIWCHANHGKLFPLPVLGTAFQNKLAGDVLAHWTTDDGRIDWPAIQKAINQEKPRKRKWNLKSARCSSSRPSKSKP